MSITLTLLFILFLINKFLKNKIIYIIIYVLLTLIILNILSSIFIGIGYYIDPIGWGENNVFSKFFITIGQIISSLTNWIK